MDSNIIINNKWLFINLSGREGKHFRCCSDSDSQQLQWPPWRDEFSSFWCPSQNFADRGWEPSKEYFNIWLCMIQKEYLIFNYPNFNCIFKSFTMFFIFPYLLWHSAKQSSIFAPLHMEMFIPQSLFLFNPLNPRSWLLPTTNTSELLFVNSKYFAILTDAQNIWNWIEVISLNCIIRNQCYITDIFMNKHA